VYETAVAGIISPMAGGQIGTSGNESSDEALAARVATHGDAAAFAILVTRYRARLTGLARRMLGSTPEEAEDAAQEAFVAAYKARAQYRRGEPYRAWLYRIVVNRCIDRRRAESRRPTPMALPEGPADPVDVAEGPLDSLLADERNERIQGAVDALPDKYRAVFLLRHLDDLSYEEIATAVDLPMGTVKTHLFRARAQLRETLKEFLTQ
jgi:RNA polymerase sigma-70 factor (ECF subfamily)